MEENDELWFFFMGFYGIFWGYPIRRSLSFLLSLIYWSLKRMDWPLDLFLCLITEIQSKSVVQSLQWLFKTVMFDIDFARNLCTLVVCYQKVMWEEVPMVLRLPSFVMILFGWGQGWPNCGDPSHIPLCLLNASDMLLSGPEIKGGFTQSSEISWTPPRPRLFLNPALLLDILKVGVPATRMNPSDLTTSSHVLIHAFKGTICGVRHRMAQGATGIFRS